MPLAIRHTPAVHSALVVCALIVFIAALLSSACGSPGDGVSPKAAATSPAPTNAEKLFETASDRFTGGGMTFALKGTGSEVTVKDGVRDESTFTANGTVVAPTSFRFAYTMSGAGLPPAFEAVTLDGKTMYLRLSGTEGWIRTDAEVMSLNLDLQRSYRVLQSAALSMEIVRTEEVTGVLCDVVEVKVDAAELERNEPMSRYGESLAESLGLEPQQVASALAQTTMTHVVWIGRNDGLPWRETDDEVTDLGELGTYEEHEETFYSDFGEAVEPPIVMPSPIITAPPSKTPEV